jgi:hypothetical protein
MRRALDLTLVSLDHGRGDAEAIRGLADALQQLGS